MMCSLVTKPVAKQGEISHRLVVVQGEMSLQEGGSARVQGRGGNRVGYLAGLH